MNNLIYDIGMHTGRDTDFYLKKGFNVVSIEANPSLVERAKIKFESEIETGQLVIIDKAIASDSSSEIEFYVNEEKDDWGTISPDWNRTMNSNYRSIVVKTIQLDTIVRTYGIPYYIKIDIEGADILCLKSLLKMDARPDLLSIELLTPSNLPNRKVDCLEILAHLNALGYRKFKISDQSKNETIKSPSPALEGQYVDYTFGGDCSGLFGKELDSSTYSLDEVARMYLEYFYDSGKVNPSILYRILRKLGLKEDTTNHVFHANGWFDIHAIKEQTTTCKE